MFLHSQANFVFSKSLFDHALNAPAYRITTQLQHDKSLSPTLFSKHLSISTQQKPMFNTMQ